MSNILEGIGKRLEIHPDRIVIKRTDLLATFVPGEFFSGEESILFTEMTGAHLHQPEKLRLGECEAGCIQLVLTRADHTHVSLTLKPTQIAEARAMRDLLQTHIERLAQR